MESHYFPSEKFLPVCAHCGSDTEHVPIQEVEVMTEGRQAYTICRDCFKEGKKPLLHGQKTKIGKSNADRKRGHHYNQESNTKGKEIGKNMTNKKGKNDCKNKDIAYLFKPQKKVDSCPKKGMLKPLPEWAKDTRVPV